MGQQKVGNGWNRAQEKEAGWVKDCACVVLVLCFAGDSSKMKGFIDDAVEAGGSGWKPYGYFAVQTYSGWSSCEKPSQTKFELNQTNTNSFNWF